MNVVFSETAKAQFDKMNLKQQRNVRRVVELLKAGHEDALNLKRLPYSGELYAVKVDGKARAVLRRKLGQAVVVRFE